MWAILSNAWLLKCLFSKGESSLVPTSLCAVDTGSLSSRIDTIFTKEDRSFYLSAAIFISALKGAAFGSPVVWGVEPTVQVRSF
jgi:hypothetical protein